MSTTQLQTRIKQFVERLADEVEATKSSAPLLEYLRFASTFHDYSIHNSMLIMMQCPQATQVAGFHAWRKLGRTVKRGERGIAILAPITMKKQSDDDPDERTAETVTRFRTVYVFDVSQTEGDDLPEAPVLTGDACDEDLALALTLFADEQGIAIKSEKINGNAMGLSKGGMIILDEELEGADRFAVMVHEIGHELLKHRERRNELDKQAREIEAESVAFVVCEHFSVPCTAPAYLALHNADSKEIIARLSHIVGVIQQIITGVESHLTEFRQAANQ
mgnify:CR=1 FL=1